MTTSTASVPLINFTASFNHPLLSLSFFIRDDVPLNLDNFHHKTPDLQDLVILVNALDIDFTDADEHLPEDATAKIALQEVLAESVSGFLNLLQTSVRSGVRSCGVHMDGADSTGKSWSLHLAAHDLPKDYRFSLPS